MKTSLPMLALFMVCSAATAYCAVTVENRAKALAELTGDGSMFFDEHAADFMWDGLDEMMKKYQLSKEELASVLAEAALQTIGQTNLLSQYVRRGAVEALGRYGTCKELPALERLALRNDVFAASAACRVYSEIATMDGYLALVGRIFDGEGEWSRGKKSIILIRFEERLRGNSYSEKDRSAVLGFLRSRILKEREAWNLFAVDSTLAEFSKSYAESLERAQNIERVMRQDMNMDADTRARLTASLKTSRSLSEAAGRGVLGESK